jgi:hypothetical protein
MDDFRKKEKRIVSRMGCPCCDDFHKDRGAMRRIARHQLKNDTNKMIRSELDD